MRILVVEDDDPLRSLLQRGLGEDGHVLDALPDGRQCSAYLASAPYDAVVLDLNLPHQDGLTLLRRLRDGGETIPVLVLTARDGTGDVVAGLDAGADDYLRKPFAFDELEARLRSLSRRPPSWTATPSQLKWPTTVPDSRRQVCSTPPNGSGAAIRPGREAAPV